MTPQQAILFVILILVFVMLIWGRWRYDLVAFIALMVAVLAGVVPVAGTRYCVVLRGIYPSRN